MTHKPFDPDKTHLNDGPYWAAALVLAVQAGDRQRAATARKQLRRLGLDDLFSRKEAKDGR